MIVLLVFVLSACGLVALAQSVWRERGTPRAARPIPPRIVIVSAISWLWGVITLLVFVPASALFTWFLFGWALYTTAEEWRFFVCAFFASATISCLALAFRLFNIGVKLTINHELSAKSAQAAARHAWWHHGGIFVIFPVLFMFEPFSTMLSWQQLTKILFIPCSIGLGIGGLLASAAKAPSNAS